MMKNRLGFVILLSALVLALTSSLHAETLKAIVRLTPEAVVPPPSTPETGLNVNAIVTINVKRQASVELFGVSEIDFKINFITKETVVATGLFFREGAANTNGPIHIDMNLSDTRIDPTSPQSFGLWHVKGWAIPRALVQRMLANPAGFYIELTTSVNPNGALRGQFHKFTESLANTVLVSPVNEVPPIIDVTARGTSTVTINPTRGSKGEMTGGQVTFSVIYELPANSEIIGLNIHKGAPRTTGDIVISSGLSHSNSIISPTGRGTLSLTVRVKPGEFEALKQLINDPASYYVNLQTKTHESGLIRG